MSSEAQNVNAEEVENWFTEEDDTEEPNMLGQREEEIDPVEKYAKSQLRVVRETKDYQLDYLKHALQPGRELIDISPAYQRRLRWTNKKKSLLIESFLLNIPVPPIYLFERDYNEYEVIDGRQRLEAISSFLRNDFALTSLEYWSELNRKRFNDLPSVLKRGLLRRSLPAVVLLAETNETQESDLDVRRVLFDRLNTGGIRLNPQELRNALYPGTLNALLIRISRSNLFTSTWGIPEYVAGEEESPSDSLLRNPLFASLADAELVLRFFALKDAILSDKSGSLRKLLDKYMEKNANLPEHKIDTMRSEYAACLRTLSHIFGANIFRLPGSGRLSRPLYDALMIAVSTSDSKELEQNADSIRHALQDALADSEYYGILVGRGNTVDAVRERVSLARQIISSRTTD